jgi:hypothetical protein
MIQLMGLYAKKELQLVKGNVLKVLTSRHNSNNTKYKILIIKSLNNPRIEKLLGVRRPRTLR